MGQPRGSIISFSMAVAQVQKIVGKFNLVIWNEELKIGIIKHDLPRMYEKTCQEKSSRLLAENFLISSGRARNLSETRQESSMIHLASPQTSPAVTVA